MTANRTRRASEDFKARRPPLAEPHLGHHLDHLDQTVDDDWQPTTGATRVARKPQGWLERQLAAATTATWTFARWLVCIGFAEVAWLVLGLLGWQQTSNRVIAAILLACSLAAFIYERRLARRAASQ